MGSILDGILDAMMKKDRPMTTVEILNEVYGDYPEWERSIRRSTIYQKMRILERQGFVKKGAMLGNDRLWVMIP